MTIERQVCVSNVITQYWQCCERNCRYCSPVQVFGCLRRAVAAGLERRRRRARGSQQSPWWKAGRRLVHLHRLLRGVRVLGGLRGALHEPPRYDAGKPLPAVPAAHPSGIVTTTPQLGLQ
ncbi:uncharacterized protein LOC117652525 [Thrips palmi]|uniref:Uncharacterized protein LOC117652525 n=1 Tax=Thrips palmi TaxID=161013 RepID=A0A6P9A7U1_THRPL|nr:uncharacterized protein LOC117652525 [Thrips palmi]